MNKKKIKNNNLLSYNYDDDDKNYNEFSKFLNQHTNREKKKDAEEIFEMGETLLSEIDQKKYINEKKKDVMIKYITSKTDKYLRSYLKELDIADVIDIHTEIKNENKSFFIKFIDWIFS